MENLFYQTIRNDIKIYENVKKIAIGQRDDYTAVCLLNYSYFIENYKFIAIDLSKHQTLNADPKVIQQINFTGNLGQEEGAWMVFILEEVKETSFSILNKER